VSLFIILKKSCSQKIYENKLHFGAFAFFVYFMFGRWRDTKRAGQSGDYKIPEERLGQTCSANPWNFHSRKSEL